MPSHVESLHRWMDTYRRFVLHQALIVATECGHKHEAMHSFEAMYPLLAFRTLTTDIKHMVVQLAEFEEGLCDACRSKAGTKNILVVRNVVLSEQTIDMGVITSPHQRTWRLKG